MRILVCEDDNEIIQIISILIEDMQLDVELTYDAEGLKKALSKSAPQLIVLDYWIKNTKADQIVMQIKMNPKLKNTAILLISAINNIEQISKDLGVDDYIAKPFDIYEFQQKVKNLIYADEK